MFEPLGRVLQDKPRLFKDHPKWQKNVAALGLIAWLILVAVISTRSIIRQKLIYVLPVLSCTPLLLKSWYISNDRRWF